MKKKLTSLKIKSFSTTVDIKGGVQEKDSYTGACCSIEPACPSAFA